MSDLETLITRAQARPNIIAIGTEGGANDPAVAADAWADLDVTLFATDPQAEDGQAWIEALGTPKLVQHLQDEHLFGPATGAWESWLTRYAGSRRVDLKLAPAADIPAYLADDALNTLVWHRDHDVTPRATDASSHFLPVPTQADYEATLNECFWIAGNVIKGLARDNLLYANEQFNQYLRPQVLRLFAYRQTIAANGQFDPGASFKHVWGGLAPYEQAQLAATYQQQTRADTLQSLKTTVVLIEGLMDEFNDAKTLLTPAWVSPADAQLTGWFFDLTAPLNQAKAEAEAQAKAQEAAVAKRHAAAHAAFYAADPEDK